MRAVLLVLVIAGIALPQVEGAEARIGNDAPFAIPTFHCLGIYWSPPGGTASREVQVRYRRVGVSSWNNALPMRYNPVPNTEEDLADYRGSIVHLAPGSPGAGAAQPVPNFSDGYTGPAPDMGAHQRGTPPMRYGVTAGQP